MPVSISSCGRRGPCSCGLIMPSTAPTSWSMVTTRRAAAWCWARATGSTSLRGPMGHRLSRIVTKTGDDGTTGLGDGQRIAKIAPRIEACGTVDELNCALGLLLAEKALPESIRESLLESQHDLFDLGGELSIPGSTALNAAHVERLEA